MTRKTKTAGTPAAPKKPHARKAPAKPAAGEEDTIDFARTISAAVAANMAAIQRHPVGNSQSPSTASSSAAAARLAPVSNRPPLGYQRVR